MSKVILITGTSRGIGKYLAQKLVSSNIVIGCSRNSSTIEHENYSHFELDISDEISVKKMISSIHKKHGKIDVLINNAGIASMNHTLLTPLSSVEKIFKTNFFGTFLFCREVGKIMSKMKFGRIINMLTVAIPLKIEGESIYAASKSAVETFTKILSKELAPFNITCNCIGASPIQTDLIKSVPKDKIDNIINSLSIHRLGEFDDVLNVIEFLMLDKSNYISGQTINLGGV